MPSWQKPKEVAVPEKQGIKYTIVIDDEHAAETIRKIKRRVWPLLDAGKVVARVAPSPRDDVGVWRPKSPIRIAELGTAALVNRVERCLNGSVASTRRCEEEQKAEALRALEDVERASKWVQ